MERRNYDLLKEAGEIARKSEVTAFVTSPALRGGLSVVGMSFLREFNNTRQLDLSITHHSPSPMLDTLKVLCQLQGEAEDPLMHELSGAMLDMINALFIRHIAKSKIDFPQSVASQQLLLDTLNLDHLNAGGSVSPVYSNYLREREAMQ